MKYLLAALGLGALWLLWRTVAIAPESSKVSSKWRRQQDRASDTNTFEGVNWNWQTLIDDMHRREGWRQ